LGSDANTVIANFNSLSKDFQTSILVFLRSLKARRQFWYTALSRHHAHDPQRSLPSICLRNVPAQRSRSAGSPARSTPPSSSKLAK